MQFSILLLLTFNEAPTGWQIGDKVVVGGTDHGWNGNDKDNSRLQDEVLTITDISGNEIRFVNDDIKEGNRNVLRFDHMRSSLAEASETSLYAANLTRNVSFETENGKEVPLDHRAHVMLMHNADVKVANAGFYDLGRSDKTKLVDDIGENVDGSKGNGTNVRGRYALHLHKTGTAPGDAASVIEGNVVSGSPGWGIVQHESNANLTDNVVFDVVGAGIVAESGNELGAWTGNTVIKTTGIDWKTAQDQRETRERKFDLGFQGDGYWIQGAAMIENKDNTAISSNDMGMVLFGGALDGKYFRPVTTVPISQLPAETQKLFSKDQTEADIRDIPIATVEGFEAYNGTYGLQVWGHATNFDGEAAFSSQPKEGMPNTAHLGRSEVKDFKLWGNRWGGAQAQYSSNIDMKNGLILGAGDGSIAGGAGLFNNHATFNSAYDNMTVAGFKEGALVEYPNTDKDFITTTVKNSTLRDNKYNLGEMGGEGKEGRPDDFGAFLKLQNNQYEVPEGNSAPVAKFGSKAIGGLAVELDASAFMDADSKGSPAEPSNGIAAYGWDLDNNGTIDRFGRRLNQVFDKAGSREVTLTVLDGQGQATELTQTVNVQPSDYTNPFSGGDFSNGTLTQDAWKASSEWADKGWFITDSANISDGVAKLSSPGNWGGHIGEVIRDEKVRRGEQTLNFKLQNIEGAPENEPWKRNEVTVSLWGVNGQFINKPWEGSNPIQAGTLPMQSTQLVDEMYGGEEGEFFDWKNLSLDVDLGSGYDYLLFQVNTTHTRENGDKVAIDDVSLTGEANSIPGELIPPNTLTPAPESTGGPKVATPAPAKPTTEAKDEPIDQPMPEPTKPDAEEPIARPVTEAKDEPIDQPMPDPTKPDAEEPMAGPTTDVEDEPVKQPMPEPTTQPTERELAPVVQISFEEALGKIARDTAVEGEPNNARLNGGVEWTEGKVGGAATLDGANGLIRVKGSEELNKGGPYEQRTVSMWFNADDMTAEREQVLFEQGNRRQGMNMYLDKDLLYFGEWSGSTKGGTGSWVSAEAEAGKWHHAAMVLDAQAGAEGTLTAYLDGEQVGQTIATALLADRAALGVGNVSGTTQFENGYGARKDSGLLGAVDEVQIFNDALSPNQVQQLALV